MIKTKKIPMQKIVKFILVMLLFSSCTKNCQIPTPSRAIIRDSNMMSGVVYDHNTVSNDNKNMVIYVRNGLTQKMYVVPYNSIHTGDSIVGRK